MSIAVAQRQNVVRRHPVATYYALAVVFSWAVELPLVAVRQGWTALGIPFSIHYLASLGPALAAIIVTASNGGRAGLAELWGRITKWRVSPAWAAFAVGSPVALFATAALAMRLIQGEWPDLRLLGQVNYLPYLGWRVLPLWLATFGFGEEIGWRGFVLPRLQRTMSVSRATLSLGLLWVLWHLPAFFYLETYQAMAWVVLPGMIFGVLCGAVLLTWLYNGTGGSVLMVAIWHALFDLLTASKAGQGLIPVVTTAGVIATALFIANTDKPWGFRFLEKQALD